MAGVKDPSIDRGRPLQVVTIDDDGITLNKEELSLLLERDDVKESPVAVISVAGLCRTGKSFLLNFMLRYLRENGKKGWIGSKDEGLEGFPWRQGVDPTTRGIYMWSKPFHTISKDGQQMVIILMDTEGLFDCNLKTDDGSAVFGLSALISSTQVFNVLNKIEEPHLKQLELFLEISRMILALVRKERPEESFQRFVWLIRDWIDNAKYEYGEKGGQKYLDATFKAVEQPLELRKLGQCIESTFQKSECYLMPHPGVAAVSTYSPEESVESMDDEDSYSSNDSDTEFIGQLRSIFIKIPHKFRKHLKKLMPYLLDPKRLSAKTIGGVGINGKMLLDNIESYVSVLNSKQLPEISSPREDFVRHFDSLLVNDLVKMYSTYVDRLSETLKDIKSFIYPEAWENDLFVQEQDIRNKFMKIASGGPDFKKKKMDELELLFISSRRDLCELLNKKNIEKLQKDHQGRAREVRNKMAEWQTVDSIDVEKAITKEEQHTRNILTKLACGNQKQKQQLYQDVQLCFIPNRVDIDEDFNNRIICNISKDHQNRIKQMVVSYNEAKQIPTSNEIEMALQNEEEKTRTIFTEQSRGDSEAKNMTLQHMDKCFCTHRLVLCKAINSLCFKEVLSCHKSRAEKLYNSKNAWKLLGTTSELDDVIRGEIEETRNSFYKQVMGDPTNTKDLSRCLEENLKLWKYQIFEDQELKRKTMKERLHILDIFIKIQPVFKRYLDMAEDFSRIMNINTTRILEVAKRNERALDFPEKVNRHSIVARFFGVLGSILRIAFPSILRSSSMSAILNLFLPKRVLISRRREARRLCVECRDTFEKTKNALDQVIRTVKRGSHGLNEHKILNILLSVTAARTSPAKFFNHEVMTYLLDPSVPPPMYIGEMDMSNVIKDGTKKVFLLKHIHVVNWEFHFDALVCDRRILLSSLWKLADETRFFRAKLLLRLVKAMKDTDRKLRDINSVLTKYPDLPGHFQHARTYDGT